MGTILLYMCGVVADIGIETKVSILNHTRMYIVCDILGNISPSSNTLVHHTSFLQSCYSNSSLSGVSEI